MLPELWTSILLVSLEKMQQNGQDIKWPKSIAGEAYFWIQMHTAMNYDSVFSNLAD